MILSLEVAVIILKILNNFSYMATSKFSIEQSWQYRLMQLRLLTVNSCMHMSTDKVALLYSHLLLYIYTGRHTRERTTHTNTYTVFSTSNFSMD